MRHKTFKLESLPEGFHGTIDMVVPKHTEKQLMLLQCGAQDIKQSNDAMSKEARMEATMLNVPILKKIYEHAQKEIKSVLINCPDGSVITDKEQLDYEPGFQDLYVEIAVKYLEGFGPGKTMLQGS